MGAGICEREEKRSLVRAMAEGEIATHSLIPGTCEPTATEGECTEFTEEGGFSVRFERGLVWEKENGPVEMSSLT